MVSHERLDAVLYKIARHPMTVSVDEIIFDLCAAVEAERENYRAEIARLEERAQEAREDAYFAALGEDL